MMTLNEPKAMQRSISRGLTAGVALPHFVGFDCLTRRGVKGQKKLIGFISQTYTYAYMLCNGPETLSGNLKV